MKAVIKNGCRIGNYVRINAFVFMERVEIGNNVFIGPHTVFTDDLHPPCPKYAECVPKTTVGSNVSIGEHYDCTRAKNWIQLPDIRGFNCNSRC